MHESVKSDLELGFADLRSRLSKVNLEIFDHKRPWPDRMAAYFVIGNGDHRTDIVLSDEFVRNLPKNREYQSAVDSYASAVAGRVRCGSPEVFYCACETVIRAEINWPSQAAVFDGAFTAWLFVNVTDQVHGTVARCAAVLGSFPFASVKTELDEVRSIINRIRTAVDAKTITFYASRNHPNTYQKVTHESTDGTPRSTSPSETERFIAGKTYCQAFRALEVPGQVWVRDPWDAEYLGISVKELSQAAHVLRARNLIQPGTDPQYARPADKLLTDGWPAAVELIVVPEGPRRVSPSTLPKKEKLIADLDSALLNNASFAVMVIDLDHFKTVNDTKGHSEGDACLERVVEAIAGVLGRRGVLYRWGGDEFAICLPDFSKEEAFVTAERIRRAVEESSPGHDIVVTASIGVSARNQKEKLSAQELLDMADQAMYASKRKGKNRVTAWPVAAPTSP